MHCRSCWCASLRQRFRRSCNHFCRPCCCKPKVTEHEFPNGEEIFGQYLQHIIDEAEDSDELYVKAYTLYLVKKHLVGKCPVFPKGATEHEILKILKDAEAWEYPEYFCNDTNCPYYYTGRTPDGSPVWIAELGKPDPCEIFKHAEVVKALDRTILKMVQLCVKSSLVREPKVHFRGLKVVVDLEGMQWTRVMKLSVVTMGVIYGKRYMDLSDELIDEIVIINATHFIHTLLNKFHWLVSKILKKVKIYGPDSSTWTIELRKVFPQRTLPAKYGGSLTVPPLYAHEYANLFREARFARSIERRNVIQLKSWSLLAQTSKINSSAWSLTSFF